MYSDTDVISSSVALPHNKVFKYGFKCKFFYISNLVILFLPMLKNAEVVLKSLNTRMKSRYVFYTGKIKLFLSYNFAIILSISDFEK